MNLKLKTLLLVLPLLVAGCGSSGGGSDSSSSKSEETSSQQGTSEHSTSQGGSSSEIKSVNIRFWHTFGQTVVDAVTSKITAFQELVKQNTGVDVNIELSYQGSYDDIAKKITNGFAVGNIPTISVAYPDNVADYLEEARIAKEDYVANLEEFINSDYGFGKEKWLGDLYDETDFVEDFYREGQSYIFDGTYSLPFMKSTEIMFYNYDMVEKAMTYYDPTINSETKIKAFMKNLTWDTFMDFCEVINEHKEAIGNMLELPAYYDSDGNMFVTKMFQNEIAYASINENQKGVIEFAEGKERENTIEMLKDLREIGPKGKNLITTKGVVGKYGSDYFTNEKVAFSIGSSGGAGYNFPQQDAFNMGVCRVPYSNDNPLYVSQGPTLCMFNNNAVSEAENYATKLYAWRFLKYITNGQVNTELCVNGSEGYIPVRNSAYETELFQTFMEEGEKYAECYKVVISDINTDAGYLVSPAFKGSAELRDQGGTLITSVLNATNDDQIDGLLQKAIDNAYLKF